MQIERILAEADCTTMQHGALRLAEALTGTLLDELERLQKQGPTRDPPP